MGFRIVSISHHCKLEYRMNYLIVRSSEECKKVFIDEISILIVENTAVSITAVLLQELINKNIDIIFCDKERNPNSLLLPIYGCHDTNVKIKKQIVWSSIIKQKVWTQIVRFKVENQGFMLKFLNIEDEGYFVEKSSLIKLGDEGNIEAQAAKKYFHLLFGNKFVRASDTPTNAALNYGYSLLLSIFNREIVKNGYLTQLGIGHKNVNNHFNLGSDLMEPFRPLIDKIVKESNIQDNFETEEKHQMLQVFENKLVIDGKTFSLLNTIERYTSNVFKALNGNDISLIKNYRYGKN